MTSEQHIGDRHEHPAVDAGDPFSLLGAAREIDADLVAVAAGDRAPTPEEEQRLEALRQERGVHFYSDLLFRVTNEYFAFDDAQRLWTEILEHKTAMSRALGRNVRVAVATLDYLTNVRDELSGAEIISEEKLRAIAQVAVLDPVTGLLSRAVFESRLANEIHRHDRYGNRVSLIMLDVDDFKQVNDLHGHRKGDEVLKQIALCIADEVRNVDIACRYGGEEFALILPQTSQSEAAATAERLRARVQQEFSADLGLTVSLGVANCPDNATTLEALIEGADRALYAAKGAGKNRACGAQRALPIVSGDGDTELATPKGITSATDEQDALIKQASTLYPSRGLDLLEHARDIAARENGSGLGRSLRSARTLVGMRADHVVACAGLLSSARRSGLTSRSELDRAFGSEAASLVEEVFAAAPLRTDTKEHQHEDAQTLLSGFSGNPRAAVLKLGMRLADLQANGGSEVSARAVAEETLELYAPLAARLGMRRLRRQLEDEAFRIIEPQQYQTLAREVAPQRHRDREFVEVLKEVVQRLLVRNGIAATMEGRVKGIYSLHCKMVDRGLTLPAVMDRLGLRVIVSSVMDCYTTLGLLHAHFRPAPETFRDYISLPKNNGYQSLHTCVYPLRTICVKPVEFQIRTGLMHQEAEYGVAAHWLYKASKEAGTADSVASSTENLQWLEGVGEQYDHCATHQDFLESLRRQVFEETMVVFGNAGQRVYLPARATLRELVLRYEPSPDAEMRVAVNGEQQPLDCPLRDGDTVDLSQFV